MLLLRLNKNIKLRVVIDLPQTDQQSTKDKECREVTKKPELLIG